jgi:hypothetical protein
MINVKKIDPQLVSVYDPDDQLLGLLNEYEFNDLRAQIAEQEVEGYKVFFEDEIIEIDKNGRYNRPEGLFTLYSDTLLRIIKSGFKKICNNNM